VPRLVWEVELTIKGCSETLEKLLENYGAKDVPELLKKANDELDDPGLEELILTFDVEIFGEPHIRLEEVVE
jgi:hypothetical protein